MNKWNFGLLSVRAFGGGENAVWLTMSHNEAAELSARLGDVPATLLAVEGVDWNRDLTPWPAPSIFRGQPDFGGGAEAYLRLLTSEILPVVVEEIHPKRRWIAGYSLAGMFAVWAAMESDAFSAVASVSGSIWYPGFTGYLDKKSTDFAGGATRKKTGCSMKNAYFSLGDKERFGRNPAFRTIEDRTRYAAQTLSNAGVHTVYETNPGGHFDDPVGRMARAIEWLCGQQ